MANIGRIVQIQLWGHALDSEGVKRVICNSFCYRLVSTGTGLPTKNGLATYFNNLFWLGANLHVPGFVGDRYDVWYPMDVGDTPTTVSVVPYNGPASGARLPLNKAVYAQSVTASRGRSYYGRKHFAPVAVADVVGDELTSSALANWQGDIGTLLLGQLTPNGGAGSRWKPVVWSRKLSPPVGSGLPADGADVVNFFVDRTLAQWRHRLHRIGHKCGCCSSRLPLTLNVKFGPTGCPSVAGKTLVLSWVAANNWWAVNLTPAAFPNDLSNVTFICGSDSTQCFTLRCIGAGGSHVADQVHVDADTCYPFHCTFNNLQADGGHPCFGTTSTAEVYA